MYIKKSPFYVWEYVVKKIAQQTFTFRPFNLVLMRRDRPQFVLKTAIFTLGFFSFFVEKICTPDKKGGSRDRRLSLRKSADQKPTSD